MTDTNSNKTIARNTVFLYLRSLITMAVGLFTSRVILQAIGVSDYGLYGAIGSIVAMFSMMNGVLSAGTSRFLIYELGTGNKEKLRKTFSASFTMHVSLAIILFILLETVGLWFVNNKLNIPEGREFAANVVYQLSILSSMISLTQVPYSASIIAHEKMDVYAYVSIVEVIFKLSLVTMLLYVPFTDTLIAYAIILALWSIGLQVWYRFYCYKRFEESHLVWVGDKSIYKGMLSYSLWDFVGQFCVTGNSQGLNLLLNMFFGTTVNAARSIAFTVEGAVSQFANNFLTASAPQITKSYAQKNYSRFLQLITDSSKFAFYLLFMIALPVFLEANYLLEIWLVEVPEYTIVFLRYTIYFSLFRVVVRPIITGTHATGNIKYLNLTSGSYSAGTYLLAVYIAYKLGAPYWACLAIQAFNGIVVTYFELTSLKRNVPYSRSRMLMTIMFKPWFVCLLASVPSIMVVYFFEEGFMRLILTSVVSVLSIALAVYWFGLDDNQRHKVIAFICAKMPKNR